MHGPKNKIDNYSSP